MTAVAIFCRPRMTTVVSTAVTAVAPEPGNFCRPLMTAVTTEQSRASCAVLWPQQWRMRVTTASLGGSAANLKGGGQKYPPYFGYGIFLYVFFAILLCIVPILSDDLRGESTKLEFPAMARTALRRFQCSRGGPAFTTDAGAVEPAMCQTRGPKVVGSSPGLGTARLRSKGYEGQAPRTKPTTQDESREELILGGKKTW